MILSSGPVLRVPLSELRVEETTTEDDIKLTTLDEAERQAILNALRETHGIIAGV